MTATGITLGELAVRFGCELRGDPRLVVERVDSLESASDGALSFLINPKYRPQLATTRATAVILGQAAATQCPVAALVAANPHAVYARVAEILHPSVRAAPGVHPSAVVDPAADVDPSAHVAAQAFVGPRARIGARTFIGPGCVVEEGAQLAADVRLVARVTICHGVRIDARTIVHPGAVIGADGFGLARDGGRWIKVPQLGSVRIGEDVEIGANTTIDRGAIGDTIIEEGVKLDNLIQVGHNCVIGAHSAIAACTGIAGSTIIGKRCQVAGRGGFAGHLTVCDDVIVTATSVIMHSITEPGVYSAALPAVEAQAWRKTVARLRSLDDIARRLLRLERAAGDRAARHIEPDPAQAKKGDPSD
jgi:UDP-3-O-[3-hydroxymyristoyl] glucosamine N-acyltransferase